MPEAGSSPPAPRPLVSHPRPAPITIRGYPVASAKEVETPCFEGAGGDSLRCGQSEGCQCRRCRASRSTRTGEAEQHLLAVTPSGDGSDAWFDQVDRQFCVGLDRVAMKEQLAAAPRARPAAALTIGKGAYFTAWKVLWPLPARSEALRVGNAMCLSEHRCIELSSLGSMDAGMLRLCSHAFSPGLVGVLPDASCDA